MLALVVVASPAVADTAGTITVYPMTGITDLAAGADGNMWMAQFPGKILKVSPSDGLVLDTYAVTGGGSLALGPDDRIWFQESDTQLGAITTSGDVTTYDIPSGCYRPTRGPGQTIWLTCGTGAGQLDIATGTVTQFSLPPVVQTKLVLGPDGNMWFGYFDNPWYYVAKISPDTGAVTPYRLDFICTSGFNDIAAGPDDKIWFDGFNDVEHCGGGALGAITTDGTIGPSAENAIFYSGITEGPDGNIWVGDNSPYHAIWRVDPSGNFTEFPLGNQGASGHPVAGPDGRVWFFDSGQVAAITTGVTTTVPVGTVGLLGLAVLLGLALLVIQRRSARSIA